MSGRGVCIGKLGVLEKRLIGRPSSEKKVVFVKAKGVGIKMVQC